MYNLTAFMTEIGFEVGFQRQKFSEVLPLCCELILLCFEVTLIRCGCSHEKTVIQPVMIWHIESNKSTV